MTVTPRPPVHRLNLDTRATACGIPYSDAIDAVLGHRTAFVTCEECIGPRPTIAPGMIVNGADPNTGPRTVYGIVTEMASRGVARVASLDHAERLEIWTVAHLTPVTDPDSVRARPLRLRRHVIEAKRETDDHGAVIHVDGVPVVRIVSRWVDAQDLRDMAAQLDAIGTAVGDAANDLREYAYDVEAQTEEVRP